MALKVLSKEEELVERVELGDRIARVQQLSGLTGRALTKRMGRESSSWMDQLRKGKSKAFQRIPAIANACAGQGLLKDASAAEIERFLRGLSDELTITLEDGSSSQMSYFDSLPVHIQAA